MSTAGIRRRGYNRDWGEKLVFEYTHTANTEMIPISYDSTTKILEVNEIPEAFGLTVGTYKGVNLHVLNRTVAENKIPIKRLSKTVNVTKVDDTHIMLEDTGNDMTTSVPKSGTYALDAFRFEVLENQVVKLLDRQDALGHTFRVNVTDAYNTINKYTNYWLGKGRGASDTHYVGDSYEQPNGVCDFILEFTINKDGTITDTKIPYLYHKKYWHPGMISVTNKTDLVMTLANWPANFETISLALCYFNGTNVKVYKIS